MTTAAAFAAERVVVNDGVVLAIRAYGPADAEPVLMLHGFPEMGSTWAPLAHNLGDIRVVAPDLRGHGLSDVPRRTSAYRLDRLVSDVVAVIDLLGGRVNVVGHDWGGALLWLVAERYPERVRTATILSAPHPLELRTWLRSDADQRARARYVLQAQLPLLPEWYLGRHDARALESWFRATHTAEEIDAYRTAWSRPGVIKGMVSWYRALVRHPGPTAAIPDARRRVLLITGADDPLFGEGVLAASVDRLPGAGHIVLDGVGHSPHRQAIDETAALLRDHWGRHDEPTSDEPTARVTIGCTHDDWNPATARRV